VDEQSMSFSLLALCEKTLCLANTTQPFFATIKTKMTTSFTRIKDQDCQ